MRSILLVGLALAAAAPSGAAAPDPFAAWNSGDFPHAVEYARPQAQSGDADAQYLLGEAYRLGRGVPADPATALGWYRRAAAQGHVRASDALGLLLFAQGQRADAMPILVQAAERGEPRALYLVGTAHFNGDFVAKDWPLAYAMMSRAADAGIAQARQSLAQMDRYLTPTDKAKAQTLLTQRTRTAAAPSTPPRAPVAPRASQPAPVATAPAVRSTTAIPAAAPTAATPAPASTPAPRGKWRVQLGAFGSAERAEAAWTGLIGKYAELRSLDHQVANAGAIRRLQATGLAGREEANALCRRISAAGGSCIPIAPAP